MYTIKGWTFSWLVSILAKAPKEFSTSPSVLNLLHFLLYYFARKESIFRHLDWFYIHSNLSSFLTIWKFTFVLHLVLFSYHKDLFLLFCIILHFNHLFLLLHLIPLAKSVSYPPFLYLRQHLHHHFSRQIHLHLPLLHLQTTESIGIFTNLFCTIFTFTIFLR